jgi:hypothetical protein
MIAIDIAGLFKSLLMVSVKSLLLRGTCPAYFCLLLPREQATVSHDHEEDWGIVKGSGLVDNNKKGAGTAPRNRTGRECLIVCLWGYATYLTVHSTLAHLDRGRIYPTTTG